MDAFMLLLLLIGFSVGMAATMLATVVNSWLRRPTQITEEFINDYLDHLRQAQQLIDGPHMCGAEVINRTKELLSAPTEILEAHVKIYNREIMKRSI